MTTTASTATVRFRSTPDAQISCDTPGVEDSSLVEIEALGYKRAMKTEVRIAPRWGNAVKMYLGYLRATKQSENTIYLRSWQLRRFSQSFRSKSPWMLTTFEIEGFMNSISYMSVSSARSMLTAIRGFYRYGLRRGLIMEDPTLPIDSIAAQVGKPRPAADRDIASALQGAPERTQMMIYLGAFLGLRRSEIARVHTDDLHHRADGYVLRVLGKGNKERFIPCPGIIVAFIQQAEPGWLFPSWHRGQVRSDSSIDRTHLQPARIGELVREALPDGVTTHQLRHRFASTLYQTTGHDIRAVQDALGHSSVATTQVYTAVPQDALRSGVAAAASLSI